jgi:hypothetical protein
MSQTIADISAKIMPIVGRLYTLPKTTNKGLPGTFLERLLGIPQTPNCLDCSDGELKTFPVKRLKNGRLVPKESIAVTMLSTQELKDCHFQSSKCCKKMSRMLLVPYLRTNDTIRYMAPRIIDREAEDCAELYAALEADYSEIRAQYLDSGILKSRNGKFLQNRTKGAGHGTTSRAFYLRPAFMKQCVQLSE